MPRTTLDLDAHVLHELKRRREEEGKSIGQLASELLAVALDQSTRVVDGAFEWETAPMGPAAVDLEDKDALWAVLDQR